MTIDEVIAFCVEKSNNIKLKAEPQVFIQLAEWLEELKVYQQHEIICRNGYNAGYKKALDDFVNACKSNSLCHTFGLRQCDIDEIAEQLKAGRENDS